MTLNHKTINWAEEFNGAVTVCDLNGKIVYMNKHSIQQFEKYGGAELMGSNLLDCHPEPSKSKLKALLTSGAENMYTTEKNGDKKIIFQTPWKEKGVFKGIIEISFNLIADMPHFIRD